MKTFIIPVSLSLALSVPFVTVAGTNPPAVSFNTTSLGYPYTKTFQVNVTFSEPVLGLNPSQVQVTNGSVDSITGSGAQYVMVISPITPGTIEMTIPANTVQSLTNTPNQASMVLRVSALDPLVRPSSNFDLKPWHLTMPLPLGNQSSAIVIAQPTLSGIPAENSGYTKSPYFFTEPAIGAMTFFTPLNGATTDNSDYPRTEFSEILNWTMGAYSSNTMVASVRVSQVPPSKKIVIGQIHHKAVTDAYGKKVSAKPLFKITYDLNKLDPNKAPCGGCIYGQVRTIPGQDKFLKIVSLAKNIPLDRLFIYRLTLLKDGTLTLKVNDSSTTTKINTSKNNTMGWGAQNLYFKAGLYIIDNGTSNAAGGRVSFYSLQIKHDK